MLIYNNKPIQIIEVEKVKFFHPPKICVVHKDTIWLEKEFVCVFPSEDGVTGVDTNGEGFHQVYETLDWNLSLFFQYLNEGWPGDFSSNGKVIRNVFGVPIADEESILYHVSDQRSSNFLYSQLRVIDIDSHVNFWTTTKQTNIQDVAATPMEALYSLLNSKYPGEFTTDAPIESATVIKNKHGYIIANQKFVFFYDGECKYGDFTPADIEEASYYLRNTVKGEAVDVPKEDADEQLEKSDAQDNSVKVPLNDIPKEYGAMVQSLGTWSKRYLVCWEAFYANVPAKMDAIVLYNFANKDLVDFKKEILFPITKERAGGKDKFEAGITITSICEV